MATYRTCIADANTQKQELEDTKVNALRQIHEVVKQSDQIIKLVSLARPSWKWVRMLLLMCVCSQKVAFPFLSPSVILVYCL